MFFSKVRRIFSEKFEFFQKWGFNGFLPPSPYLHRFWTDLDEIFTQCSDVDEKLKN